MISYYELPTPLVLVDLDRLERNIFRVADLAKMNDKILWPMFKTSKSTYIAKLQVRAGANGFLCGSLDEAEVLAEHNLTRNIMIAYPVADKANFIRLTRLMRRDVRVIVRIDSLDLANLLNKHLERNSLSLEYCVEVDVGDRRFGVNPEKVGRFVDELRRYSHLKFVGLATHQGNAYEATCPKEVEEIAFKSAELMDVAVRSLRHYGFEPEIIGAGATPTFRFDVNSDVYTHLFPGNYIYYDRIQALVYGSASINDCALTVLATVISIPDHAHGIYAMINAGSRFFDKRVRGGLKGYGQLVKYPQAFLVSVSQEVSKLDISCGEAISVGDRVRVIPNHSCFTNDGACFLIGHRSEYVREIIPIDAKSEIRLNKTLLEGFLIS